MNGHSAVLNRDESRQVDQIAINEYGIPGIVLMENAGRGVAEIICDLGIQGTVSIWCGPGNNGGDGFVIARHLHNRGNDVHLSLLAEADKLRGDAKTNFQIVQNMRLPAFDCSAELEVNAIERLHKADWVIDCLLGTGAMGEPRSKIAAAIQQLNQADAKRMAVDVPSGLDCDTGQPSKITFRADHTCTFVAAKPMTKIPAARPYLGQIHVVDIGIPPRIIANIIRNRDGQTEIRP